MFPNARERKRGGIEVTNNELINLFRGTTIEIRNGGLFNRLGSFRDDGGIDRCVLNQPALERMSLRVLGARETVAITQASDPQLQFALIFDGYQPNDA